MRAGIVSSSSFARPHPHPHPPPLLPPPPTPAANAFLGICHSLAHKLGSAFHVPHGLANAALISHVIRYNATDRPFKQAAFPQYQYPQVGRWGKGALAGEREGRPGAGASLLSLACHLEQ